MMAISRWRVATAAYIVFRAPKVAPMAMITATVVASTSIRRRSRWDWVA